LKAVRHNFEREHSKTIQVKLGLIWFIGFRDEDINVPTYDVWWTDGRRMPSDGNLIRWAKTLSFWHPFISETIKFSMKNFFMEAKGQYQVKQNTSITCRQSKVEQVYIKSESGHSILLDTVNCCTQKYTGNRNLLDQLYFTHLSRFKCLSSLHDIC
jgi:hypothetical protein